MKRTYIKPFMESEEFVTNEYVAACFKVDCNLCDEIDGSYRGPTIEEALSNQSSIHKGDPNHDAWGWGEWLEVKEDPNNYYHSPDMSLTGRHHRITWKEDEINPS